MVSRSMRALVVDAFGVVPSVREVPVPEAHPDAVVVAVEATGLCRSDWHGWRGHDPDIALPHIPGHELCGHVVEVGAEVRGVAVGQRVITPFVCGCGSCPTCVAGNSQVCPHQTQPGFTHDGSFAERVEVRNADHNVIAVDDETDVRDLVGLGCRVATAWRGLHDRAQVRAGERVAVLGCGGVGLSAVMIAASIGAEVVAVDVCADALDLAVRVGAHHRVDATGLDPGELAAAIRAPSGAVHVTVEALGLEATAQAALAALAPNGRHVQIGLFDAEPVLPISRIIRDELVLWGSHGMAAGDYPPLLDAVARGDVRPAAVVTREIALQEAPAALAEMGHQPGPGVTIIRPGR